MNMDASNPNPQGVPKLQFDPDKYPHSTLKAFNEFIEQYEFRYDAQYPEVPKHVLDNAVEKWKSENDNAAVIPIATKETLKADIRSRDKVRKLLGFFATLRLQQDWKAAEPVEANRNCTWKHFVDQMQAYYKPTENSTLGNYEFRQLHQNRGEAFHAFCNRIEKEGKTCTFCECDKDSACTSTANAVRDQIVIGTDMEKIRERALLKGWNLENLRKEGMKMESASRGEDSMSSGSINKVGAYSFTNLRNQRENPNNQAAGNTSGKKQCYRCGEKFSKNHMQSCRATSAKCGKCHKVGHFA